MLRPIIFAFALLATILSLPPRAAHAEPTELGEERQLVISVERVAGFVYGNTVVDQRESTPGIDETGTSVGLSGGGPRSPRFAVPRLAVDRVFGSRLTVGVALGYARQSSDPTFSLDGNTFVIPSSSSSDALVAGARVGYVAPLARAVSWWPRVGFTYLLTHRNAPPADILGNEIHEAYSFYALTIEAPVVLRVVDHVVAMVSPTLDLGLRGTLEGGAVYGPPLPNRPAREIDLGVTVGLAAFF